MLLNIKGSKSEMQDIPIHQGKSDSIMMFFCVLLQPRELVLLFVEPMLRFAAQSYLHMKAAREQRYIRSTTYEVHRCTPYAVQIIKQWACFAI